MRLVTWNVAGRVGRQPEQAEALLGAGADVVALQEVTVRTEPLWRESLAAAGFGFVRDRAGRAAAAADEAAPRGADRRALAVGAAAGAAGRAVAGARAVLRRSTAWR